MVRLESKIGGGECLQDGPGNRSQRAFVYLWETFAARYRAVPGQVLSFSLINEPPAPGERGMRRANHAALIRRIVCAIRIAMRWYADMLSVFREFGLGYALWNFQGPFGIIDHRRPGARLELVAGYQVDSALLDLIRANRV